MTIEELMRVLCPSFMAYKCEKLVDCNDCKEKMNKWLDKYDKQKREEIIDEIIPKVIDLLINADVISEKNRITDTNWLIEQLKEKNNERI